jgi:hypothetical protein
MYTNSKIYKITDITYTESYYGSTTQALSKRFGKHRSDYNIYKSSGRRFYTSFILFDKYGLENCKIELVEDYECKTKEELHKREGYWIKNNPCVNKTIAGRTNKEWIEDNKERYNEQKKIYIQENKDKFDRYHKDYREANKDKINNYREANKNNINEYKRERVECDICNKEVSRNSLTRHKILVHKE